MEADASRASTLRALLEKRPGDPRLLFGLAVEELNGGRLEAGVETLRKYLAVADDEGNAWGRLADALLALNREEEARVALRTGIEAALRHGHPTMAQELQEALEALE
jgi:Flp pilus assembly protein TadD